MGGRSLITFVAVFHRLKDFKWTTFIIFLFWVIIPASSFFMSIVLWAITVKLVTVWFCVSVNNGLLRFILLFFLHLFLVIVSVHDIPQLFEFLVMVNPFFGFFLNFRPCNIPFFICPSCSFVSFLVLDLNYCVFFGLYPLLVDVNVSYC